jgi:tetratricopeptide (TPR) repeat protein
METTVFDALETDSVAISDSEEYKKAGVITDAYSEPAEAHEIHVKKSQKVISEVEYTGKEEAELGGNGLPATQESALDKAHNEYLDGNAYFKKEDYEQAALKYQMALELATEEKVAAVSAYQLGRSYQELEQFEQAITVYRDLVRKHPDFPGTVDVYLAIGECYLGMGDSENALRSFELVLDEFPDKREIAQEKINQTKAQQEPAEDTEESQPEANTTD